MTSDRVRTTISLPLEIHAIFKRMSDASGMSVSRCMGDWLADTGDAAEMVTSQLEKARRSPMDALREMRALVAGLGERVEQVDSDLGNLIGEVEAAEERSARPQLREDARSGSAAAAPLPPSSNTGGKSPKSKSQGGGKSPKRGQP